MTVKLINFYFNARYLLTPEAKFYDMSYAIPKHKLIRI